MNTSTGQTSGQEFWNINSPEDGLLLLRLKGLRILCLTIILVVPLLVVRDVFAAGLGIQDPLAIAILVIRLLVFTMSLFVLRLYRRKETSRLRPIPLAHTFFTILIVMVDLTIVKLGGSTSPVYAGLVTVMLGWCYFFAFGLSTTIPIFLLVVLGYLGVIGVFVGIDAMLSEDTMLRTSLLSAVGLLVCVSGSNYHREQKRRFEAIIKQRELAGHDPLTQVLNRFALRQRYGAALDRAIRHKRDLSLLIIDIDNFKKINDAQGHGVGDDVLRALGGILDTECRSLGQVGRWGGEEFVIILPGYARDSASEVAETIRTSCALMPIRSPRGTLRITISIGVSSLEGRDLEEANLVTEADRALYKAKAEGKNRVCTHLLGADSPEMEKDLDVFPAGTVRPLTSEEEANWSQKRTFEGYQRFALWTAVMLSIVALLEILIGAQLKEGATGLSYTELSAVAFLFLASTYGLARGRKGYVFVRGLHLTVPVAIAALFSLMAGETGGSTSPAFILVMAVLVISSFTSPGGWRFGLPTFAVVCAVWPIAMLMTDNVISAKSLVVRSTIVAVLAIVCTLAHELFHLVRYRATRLDRHLELMGTTDTLTETDNRRAFESRLQLECALAVREQSPLALVFVDMNALKQINDTYGHGAGDQALLKLVSVMKAFMRSSDIIARLGGDEFAILLPETDLKGAIQLMERIDKQLDVERVALNNNEFEVTASCGIAQLNIQFDELEKELGRLAKRADSALYAAKDTSSTAIGVHDGTGIELIQLWRNAPHIPTPKYVI